MRYASAPPFREALETRLGAASRSGGPSLARLRKEVVFDRLLARLVAVAPDRWILKGALALDYRFGDRARTTRDVDLAVRGDEASASADLLAAQAADLGDFFSFAIERTGTLDRVADGAAVRYHVVAELAGRTFDAFVLDVGFDPPAGVEPDRLHGPDLLGFASIDPVVVPALPLEFAVAEKVHAYTRAYGDRRLGSTRVKDLVDLVLIAGEASLDARRLREALEVTFAHRATHPSPARLPRPPADWHVPYGRMGRDIGLDPDLGAGHDLAASLVDPLLAGAVVAGSWDPATRSWHR
ncbi:MAG: nucleotidyl transferase AbiEii/AbiGii toxin family protein [Candidatus Limnocylindrales bacterium]